MKKTGLKRDISDKFYTVLSTVNLCENIIKKHLNITKDDFIIEPSAGNGSFIKYIKKLTKNHVFYDILPEHSDIIKSDFLKCDLSYLQKINYKKHFIGNPPFGRQSSLAIKFIKKTCLFADSFSYILPKSFKKQSLQRHIPLNYHLISQMDIPENSFEINSKIHNVPCVFQIWEKRNYNRKIPKKLIPINFKFVKKSENPDFSFRRVGVYAGKIDINCEKSEQSHYFIKMLNINKTEHNKKISLLKTIKYDHNNTTGPKSISKQELIKEFNVFLEKRTQKS